MRVRAVWALWSAILTAAWMLAVWIEQSQGLGGGDIQLVWLLRRDVLLLSGVWSLGMMSLAMWLSLRQPWMERPLGGMDQVYRLHKWLGISAAVAAVLHWGAKEAGGWIKAGWGTAGRPPRDAMLAWLADGRGLAKDMGEWAFYALLVLVVVTLWQRLLPYKPWRWVHRVMPVLYLALVWHSLVLLPQTYWQQPVGWLMGALMALGSVAALWSLLGRIGRARRYAAEVYAVQLLGDKPGQDPLEVLCALPAQWPGHRAGQFVFASWDAREGAHPFTVASAPGACGCTPDGRPLLRLVIKPLGDYTAQLHRSLQPGMAMQIEGPYGCFDGQAGKKAAQVWVAGGVGITPFLAWLEARQPDAAPTAGQQPAHLHYCTRDAAHDVLLPRVQALCAEASPPVSLTVHDAAQGQRLQPQDLERHGAVLDIWVCGPQGLGNALQQGAAVAKGQGGRWRLRREAFEMR
ncbi:MAG: ferric reductase-like transmembrane domain-containing protein [Acidovorax sp.]|nr:ferric reductase-like transmembrane domain-containing protein [Acidovorax sp.]